MPLKPACLLFAVSNFPLHLAVLINLFWMCNSQNYFSVTEVDVHVSIIEKLLLLDIQKVVSGLECELFSSLGKLSAV